MRLKVGSRLQVVDSDSKGQVWGTVHHIDLPDGDSVGLVEVVVDGRGDQIVCAYMPRTAIEEPYVPAPIHDVEALEQWLAEPE